MNKSDNNNNNNNASGGGGGSSGGNGDHHKIQKEEIIHETLNSLDISGSQKNRKCLFTSNPLTTKFNVSASPFVIKPQQKIQSPKANTEDPQNNINSILFSTPTAKALPFPKIDQNLIDARILRSISARPSSSCYSYSDDEYLSLRQQYLNTYSARCNNNNNNNRHVSDSSRSFRPIALQKGIILIPLREGIRVEMTIDKTVRVINQKSRIYIAFSSVLDSSAMIHPNGRVYQYGSRVELVAYDGMRNNNFKRYAKMWYKGISFTSENCALVYLVDTAGTRTTTDTFTDLSADYTNAVLYNDARYGPTCAKEVMSIIQNSNYWCTEEGTEIYDINNFRVSQAVDGLVKVTRLNSKSLIRTSPGNGSTTLTTPHMHCTASLGQTSHLFVRRGERRMHFDGVSFVVRNAGHSAGFDENNLLKVY